jgi:hypothetical protein
MEDFSLNEAGKRIAEFAAPAKLRFTGEPEFPGRVHYLIQTDWIPDGIEQRFMLDLMEEVMQYRDSITEIEIANLVLLIGPPKAPARWVEWAHEKYPGLAATP